MKKSYDFALETVRLYKRIVASKREFVLSKQMLRSGTSIGANIAEANGAISTADFSAKISLAYKESLEVMYWISLLKDSEYIKIEKAKQWIQRADHLAKIMLSILKTTKRAKS